MLQNAKQTSALQVDAVHFGAAALAVAAMVVFPTADALAKSLSGVVPLLVIVWVRFCGAALLITPLYLMRVRQWPTKRAIAVETLRAAIIIVAFGCFVFSFRTIQFAEATTYYSVAPIVAAGLSVLLLKERMTGFKMLALGLGMFGVLVALKPSVAPQPGAFFALSSGLLYGSYLFLNRVVAVRWDMFQTLFLQFWIGSLLLFPLVLSDLGPELLPHLPRLFAISVISVLCNLMLFAAFQRAESSFLAPFMYVEVPSALAMAVLFFDETLTINLLLGAGMILCAGLLVMRRRPSARIP
ncbi:DMT family transporter [Ruegeria litorea]|uniref:DMT family transporter n=1 Tax=Falsiruegeria litorea TaxID=1280831 RepID=A0ABS5WXJ4_9RHOB|nr:DMT family transporter [Falsiruegeria litorea]MBT3143855.1 DMT family transporter [Falsiruegeria litorea]